MAESTNGQSNGARPAGATALGRVGAPKDAEATSEEFYFWAPDDRLVEKTQLVYVESPAGPKPAHFYGLVSEVFRRSRRIDMLEESDRFDGRPEEEVPVESRGVTYAQVRVLASQTEAGHAVFTSPREESVVYPASEADVRVAYGFGEMEKSVAIGLVRNGGDQVIGPAYIDLDYLLGAQGGHMNVTGIAGVGTKSSFLTAVLSQVLRYCQREAQEHPENGEKTQVRPVILNVKGFDLFWLDHWSKEFTEEDLAFWRQMGWEEPRPMDVAFFAPQRPESDSLSVTVPGRSDVQPYSWSLEDILASGLFVYLFNDSDREDDNFALLVADIERLLSRERRQPDGTPVREMRRDTIAKTFQELFDWFERGLQRETGEDKGEPFPADALFMRLESVHHPGTVRRFYRRLRRVVYESAGIFRLDGAGSHPLDITSIEPGGA
ncbi:MAG: ATP-binding protein, partial [Dehalococcoidia bacterium]